MKLNEIFKKSIDREINGVIKVDQNDTKNLKIELEEYVITREVQRNLRNFFNSLNYSAENPTDKIGVWISGFFGSGKSHFLKMLALLLDDIEIEGKKPYEFFKEKIEDDMLIAEISKAYHHKNKVILFNIDSKSEAGSKATKDAIVNVLMKVFNNSLGYCGEIPWLAKFERDLNDQGLFETFKNELAYSAGISWIEKRENYYFEKETINTALAKVKGVSVEEAKAMFEGAEKTYSLSIEKFAEIIKRYVDKTNERVIFFIDEIGQYIGDNSHLMLNLQTVTEDLGTQLKGSAWLVVTSQEAVDQVTQVKGKDFSKIKGRFATQLTLTSDNTDTVIKKRLLEKKDELYGEIEKVYQDNEAIIKNLISFSSDTSEMKFYRDSREFADVYPFIPYQFNLVQKVFEKIRLMGATGAHLSQGERSLLSAFQEALKQIENKDVGALVPFSTFYSSIEVFLTSGIRRTINQARDNSRLEVFDIEVLKLLFMVKYLDVLKPNLENIKTLMISTIDEDKISLGDKIKESLERLEGENLIHKSGDEWIFLTDEEQDINKEIKSIQPDPMEIIDYLSEVIFSDIYTNTKYRYTPRNKDFSYLKVIDNKSYGSQQGDITLHLFTPYAEEYGQAHERISLAYSDATACILFPNTYDYLEAIKERLQIQKYIQKTNSQSFPESIAKIRSDKLAEKSRLEIEIRAEIEDALVSSEVFVNGSQLAINKTNAKNLFEEVLTELVKRTYTKLDYVNSPFNGVTLTRILNATDVDILDLFGKETNVQAIEEIQKRIEQNNSVNKKTLLADLKRSYTGRPFGWSEIDVVGILLVLLVKGLISLKHNGELLTKSNRNIINLLQNNRESDKITIYSREQVGKTRIQSINKFVTSYLENFESIEDEDILAERLKTGFNNNLSYWSNILNSYNSKNYPSRQSVHEVINSLNKIVTEKDASAVFGAVESFINFYSENSESIENISNFFSSSQREIFDNAVDIIQKLQRERIAELLPDVTEIISKIQSILENDSPFAEIKDLPPLLSNINEAYDALVNKKKAESTDTISSKITDLTGEFPEKFAEELKIQVLYPLKSLQDSLTSVKTWTEVNSISSQIDASYTSAVNMLNKLIQAITTTSQPKKIIKTVKIIELVRREKGLDTEKDVDEYVDELGFKLKEEIKKGNTIKLL